MFSPINIQIDIPMPPGAGGEYDEIAEPEPTNQEYNQQQAQEAQYQDYSQQDYYQQGYTQQDYYNYHQVTESLNIVMLNCASGRTRE